MERLDIRVSGALWQGATGFALVAAALVAGCGKAGPSKTIVVAPRAPLREFRVPAGSMEPTLGIGARVLVEPGAAPHVGEIVIFNPPVEAQQQRCGVQRPAGAACSDAEPQRSSTYFIKRVVAGPGDVIAIVEGHVIRNGKRQPDSYIKACAGAGECDFPTPIKIPPGHWFMLGDNRGESDDSRFWGPVPTSWILGVMSACVPSFAQCALR